MSLLLSVICRMIISHLVNGPTALFKVMSFVPHEDIKGVGEVTAHNPELILNNFTTRLGRRFGRFFGSMYPCNFLIFITRLG